MNEVKKLGLLGKNISYSFSQNYFSQKFIEAKIDSDFSYQNFDIQNIDKFPEILKNNLELIGLNVTIPFKETIIPFLDELSDNVKQIGAVNTIKILPNGNLFGDNTDFFGFNKSLETLIESHHKKALILGTGGSAKAVAFGLKKLNIGATFVSRNSKENCILYSELNQEIFHNFQIVVNCTPIGTFPKVELCPDISYEYFTKNHIAFDLIYNPEETEFLKRAKENGAKTKNGYDMLVFQAEKAWKIWNE